MRVPYSYLDEQFSNREDIIDAIRSLAKTGQFTLGSPVEEFEKRFADFCGVKYAIGMNSGTDALRMILIALDIDLGDEVITVPNSFIATAGAIATIGARTVFVDVNDEYLMDPAKVEKVITSRTRAILPVHLTGNMVDMPALLDIVKRQHRRNLYVVEDAAQAVDACISGRYAGNWGIAAAFSFHPLKNLNGWGDGGMVTTNEKWLAEKLRLLRNHGLRDRDHGDLFAYNCRLHSLQAVILNRLLDDIIEISTRRMANALFYDTALGNIKEIIIPPRQKEVRQVYHTYIVQVERRDALMEYLADYEIETKIHYSIPIHFQKAAKHLGYKKGDFPICESQAERIISLPIHQYLKAEQIKFVCEKIRKFYQKR